MTDTKWDWLNESIVAQFGNAIAAGKLSQYPRLKEIWLAETAAKAEKEAHYDACLDVAARAQLDWRKEN